jgi:hypothetical protein
MASPLKPLQMDFPEVPFHALSGDLLISKRRPNCDSGEPDLWSNGSVLMEHSALS